MPLHASDEAMLRRPRNLERMPGNGRCTAHSATRIHLAPITLMRLQSVGHAHKQLMKEGLQSARSVGRLGDGAGSGLRRRGLFRSRVGFRFAGARFGWWLRVMRNRIRSTGYGAGTFRGRFCSHRSRPCVVRQSLNSSVDAGQRRRKGLQVAGRRLVIKGNRSGTLQTIGLSR